MTIIYQQGDEFWIDVIRVTPANLGPDSGGNTNVDVTKSGTFLGGVPCFTALGGTQRLNSGLRTRLFTELVVGQLIDNEGGVSSISLAASNVDPVNTATDIVYLVIIFMRRPGR